MFTVLYAVSLEILLAAQSLEMNILPSLLFLFAVVLFTFVIINFSFLFMFVCKLLQSAVRDLKVQLKPPSMQVSL